MRVIMLSIVFITLATACKNRSANLLDCHNLKEQYFQLTDTLLTKSSVADNLIKLKALIEREKNCSIANISVADLFRKLDMSDSAFVYYERAFVLDTLNFYAGYILGYIEEIRKNFRSSFEFYNFVISLKTKKGIAITFSPALSSITNLPTFDVPYDELRFRRGLCLFELGDYLNAINDFNYCINKKEYLNEAYRYRSLIYFTIDEVDKGKADSFKGTNYAPSNFVFQKCQSP